MFRRIGLVSALLLTVLATAALAATLSNDAKAVADSAVTNQLVKQAAGRSPVNDEDEEWLRLLVNGILSISVGLGAAYMGAHATKGATREAARENLEAMQTVRAADIERDLALIRQALQREIRLNLSLLEEDSKLYRQIPLQNMRLAAWFSVCQSESTDQIFDKTELFIQRYNSLVALTKEVGSDSARESLSELERMRAEGILLIRQIDTDVADI